MLIFFFMLYQCEKVFYLKQYFLTGILKSGHATGYLLGNSLPDEVFALQ